ncbi:MAG: nuclease-related domain-containing protein [Cyanobacteria bacterium J06621_12]
MVNAGDNIRQLAQRRKRQAIGKFALAGVLIAVPLLPYSILGLTSISVFICVTCWVGGVVQAQKGQKLLLSSRRANKGAAAEESTALILQELEREGWVIEYNVPLKGWGDADAFVCSPNSNYFVIDTKSNNGTVFFDGTRLMLRYGKNIYSFSNDKDILKAVRGQAVLLKEIKKVNFVVPILCFTEANLDIKKTDSKVENVYVLKYSSLVKMLRQLDK